MGAEPLLPGLMKLFCTGAPLHPEEKAARSAEAHLSFLRTLRHRRNLGHSVLRPEDLTDRADSVGQPHSFAQIEIRR